MPALLLLALASTAGLVAGLVAWRYPRIVKPSARPTLDTARKVGADMIRHIYSTSPDSGKTWDVHSDTRFVRRRE
jgi:hypothetical protein